MIGMLEKIEVIPWGKNNDSRLWLGASAFLKSVDFKAFAVNKQKIGIYGVKYG